MWVYEQDKVALFCEDIDGLSEFTTTQPEITTDTGPFPGVKADGPVRNVYHPPPI